MNRVPVFSRREDRNWWSRLGGSEVFSARPLHRAGTCEDGVMMEMWWGRLDEGVTPRRSLFMDRRKHSFVLSCGLWLPVQINLSVAFSYFVVLLFLCIFVCFKAEVEVLQAWCHGQGCWAGVWFLLRAVKPGSSRMDESIMLMMRFCLCDGLTETTPTMSETNLHNQKPFN